MIVNNGTSIASGNKFRYNLTTKKGHFIGKRDETSIAGSSRDRRVLVIIGSDANSVKKSESQYEQ